MLITLTLCSNLLVFLYLRISSSDSFRLVQSLSHSRELTDSLSSILSHHSKLFIGLNHVVLFCTLLEEMLKTRNTDESIHSISFVTNCVENGKHGEIASKWMKSMNHLNLSCWMVLLNGKLSFNYKCYCNS